MALRSEPDAVCACFVCMCAVARKIWAGLTGFVLVDVGVRVERCTVTRRPSYVVAICPGSVVRSDMSHVAMSCEFCAGEV